MTKTVWPIAASAGSPSYNAGALRTTLSPLITPAGTSRPLGAISGRRVGGGLEVTVASWPTITIQPGSAILDVETPTATGPYLFSSDAVDTSLAGTVAAGSDRIDIVSVILNDQDVDGSGLRTGDFVYTAGVAGSGVAPPTPTRCLRLGTITVPHSGGGSPSVSMDSTWSVASGGLLPCLSTARPASPYAGQPIFETDTKLQRTYDGAGWKTFGGRAGIAVNLSDTWATDASRVHNGTWAFKDTGGDFTAGATTSDTTPIVIPSAGVYVVSYAFNGTTTSTNTSSASLTISGSVATNGFVLPLSFLPTAAGFQGGGSVVLPLATGDGIGLTTLYRCGATAKVLTATLSCYRVGP